jgi:hypothetical protein
MRWAGDAAEKTTYGHHTSSDLARYLDNPRSNVNAQAVAELVAGTFND